LQGHGAQINGRVEVWGHPDDFDVPEGSLACFIIHKLIALELVALP
jgi:hypothetical protein